MKIIKVIVNAALGLVFVLSALPTIAANKVVVIPLGGSEVDSQLLPIAGGQIGIGGGVDRGFGMSSATNPSTGVYTITLEQNYNSIPIVLMTSYGTTAEHTNYSFSGGNTITAYVFNATGTPANSFFSILVYANSPTLAVSSSAKSDSIAETQAELDRSAEID